LRSSCGSWYSLSGTYSGRWISGGGGWREIIANNNLHSRIGRYNLLKGEVFIDYMGLMDIK
jgi:hypothetical protein